MQFEQYFRPNILKICHQFISTGPIREFDQLLTDKGTVILKVTAVLSHVTMTTSYLERVYCINASRVEFSLITFPDLKEKENLGEKET